nr:hypothetical protein B296_00022541 [Ipomoea trifida]
MSDQVQRDSLFRGSCVAAAGLLEEVKPASWYCSCWRVSRVDDEAARWRRVLGAASGCIVSRPGPRPAAFAAATLGSANTRSRPRSRAPDLSSAHSLRTPGCSPRPLAAAPEAPETLIQHSTHQRRHE